MRIFLVTSPEGENSPFISLKSAYDQMVNYEWFLGEKKMPSFEEIQEMYIAEKEKNYFLQYEISNDSEEFTIYLEELEILP